MNRLSFIVFAVLILLAVGCAGKERTSPTQPSSASPERTTVNDPTFVLSDEGSLFAGTVTPFTVESAFNSMTGDLVVSVWARDVSDLKTALFRLTYPADAYHLVSAEYAGGLGENDDVVVAIIPRSPDVYMGAAIIHFPERDGVNGDCEVFRLTFRPGPELPARVVCAPPNRIEAKVVLEGSIDIDNVVTLTWTERNPGDGNNDGEVSIADVTPIAMNFGHSTNDSSNDPADTLADYNSDLVVNIMDVTPLAINFGVLLHGYDMETAIAYSGPFVRIPNADTPSNPTLVRSELFPNPLPTNGPLEWSYQTVPIEGVVYFRVVPKDDEGNGGIESISNVISFEGITDILSLEIRLPDGVDPWLLITEEAIDEIPGNEQSFARSSMQLEAWGMVEGKEEPVNVTDKVVWSLESGDNSANIGDIPNVNKGFLTGRDIGVARVLAHAPENFAVSAGVEIPVYAIYDIILRVAGQIEPADVTVSLGGTVDFNAIGVFDDNDGDVDDFIEQDISSCSGWPIGRPVVDEGPPVVYEAGAFSINTATGVLYTDDAGLEAGFRAFVTAIFPADEDIEPTIGGGYRANSNMITVTLE